MGEEWKERMPILERQRRRVGGSLCLLPPESAWVDQAVTMAKLR